MVLNIRHVSTISGFTEHHYIVVHYVMDDNLINCVFIQKFGNTVVTLKIFLNTNDIVFVCGSYKHAPDPLIMIFSRNRIVDSDDQYTIIGATQSIGFDTSVSWTDQTSELCSSVRLVAPCALIVFAMAVKWMRQK